MKPANNQRYKQPLLSKDNKIGDVLIVAVPVIYVLATIIYGLAK